MSSSQPASGVSEGPPISPSPPPPRLVDPAAQRKAAAARRAGATILLVGFLLALLVFAGMAIASHVANGQKFLAVMGFFLALLAVAMVVVGAGIFATGSARVLAFALAGHNTLSLSKLQMGCWTILVIATLLIAASINVWQFFPQVSGAALPGPLEFDIPNPLLAAMGIAAFSTAAVPAIISLKATSPDVDPIPAAAAVQRQAKATGVDPGTVTLTGKVVGNQDPENARLVDLISGDEAANAGTVDLSKVQQLLITLALLVTYAGMMLEAITQGRPFSTLPNPGEKFVTLLGISHAGYLAYKAAPKTGTDGKPS